MSTKGIAIVPGVDWVGVRHRDLKVFDDLFPTHNGTTYNSYLVRGSEKTALIDTVKAPFAGEFFQRIESQLPVEKVDIVIVNHTEPDHSGALAALIERNPDVTIYCSVPAKNFLEQLFNHSLNVHVVTDGEEIDLGGKTLRFLLAPYLHWPDTMFTYLIEDALLFSCDAFGAHYCSEALFDDEIADFTPDFMFYFDCIMRPFKDKIRAAVAKLDGLPIQMVCPSHGPVLRSRGLNSINAYRLWSAPPPESKQPKAVLAVLSSHGNTRSMAAEVKLELEAQGMAVLQFGLSDMREDDFRNALEQADVLVVGTPTIQRDAPPHVWHALALLSSVTLRPKLAAVFGSFGWSGEATKMVEARLTGLRLKLAATSVTCRFTPTPEVLAACRELGREVVAAVKAQG